MHELRAILDALADLDPDDEPSVLATVVQVHGSAYRGVGARRLMDRDGRALGLVSGGCLETDLARQAWTLTAGGQAAVVRYDSADPDGAWTFNLGCQGVIDILLERVGPEPPTWVSLLRSCQDRHEPAVLARILQIAAGDERARVGSFVALDGDGAVVGNIADKNLTAELTAAAQTSLAAGRSGLVTLAGGAGGITVGLERIEPPPTLIIAGAGPDALPLVRFAKELGWSVAVVDGRHRPATRGRFAAADEVLTIADVDRLQKLTARPQVAAVVMTHNVTEDARFLDLLLPSAVSYIGLLGPKQRAARLLAERAELDGPARVKLHAPVGLDLGAETPAEIALAIVAEVRATLAGRAGGSLRDRPMPIHDRPGEGNERSLQPSVAI